MYIEDRRSWPGSDQNPTPRLPRDPMIAPPGGYNKLDKNTPVASDRIIGGPQYANRGQAMTTTEKIKNIKKKRSNAY